MEMDKTTHSIDVADRPEHITIEWLLRPTSNLDFRTTPERPVDTGKYCTILSAAVADLDPTRILTVPTPS